MRRVTWTAAMASLLVFGGARALAQARLDTPENTYKAWLSRLGQYEGKTEHMLIYYSKRLLDEIRKARTTVVGAWRMDKYHLCLNRELIKYSAAKPEATSDTTAVITLTPKKKGEAMAVKLVLEGGKWLIDAFPKLPPDKSTE